MFMNYSYFPKGGMFKYYRLNENNCFKNYLGSNLKMG